MCEAQEWMLFLVVSLLESTVSSKCIVIKCSWHSSAQISLSTVNNMSANKPYYEPQRIMQAKPTGQQVKRVWLFDLLSPTQYEYLSGWDFTKRMCPPLLPSLMAFKSLDSLGVGCLGLSRPYASYVKCIVVVICQDAAWWWSHPRILSSTNLRHGANCTISLPSELSKLSLHSMPTTLLYTYITIHFLCYFVFCVPKGEVTRTFLGLDLGIHGNIPDRLHIIVGTTNPIEAWAKMGHEGATASCTVHVNFWTASEQIWLHNHSKWQRSKSELAKNEEEKHEHRITQVLNAGTESFWVVWLHCPQQ